MLIDTPRWPAHGRLWAHLVSDRSLAELHAFAASVGLPRRSFEGDHYDVPHERHGAVVAAGARLVEGRVLVKALRDSGLRLPKRKGERVLLTVEGVLLAAGAAPVDAVASTLVPPGAPLGPVLLLAPDDEGRLAVVAAHGGARLPTADEHDPRCGYLRVRPLPDAGSWRHLALRSGRRDDLVHVPPHELGEGALPPLLGALADHLRGRRPA